jgi:hypothetical protein
MSEKAKRMDLFVLQATARFLRKALRSLRPDRVYREFATNIL